MYARVLVDVASRGITQPFFDYSIPGALSDRVDVGSRVLVPFGGRRIQGFVLELSETTDFGECKEILGVTEDEPLLPPDLLETAKWMSKTYFSPLASCVRAMLPAGIKVEGERKAELLVAFEEAMDTLRGHMGYRAAELEPLVGALAVEPRTVTELGKAIGDKSRATRTIRLLEERGIVGLTDVWAPPRVRERLEMRLFPVADAVSDDAPTGLTGLQGKALECVIGNPGCLTVSECARRIQCTPGVVKRLVDKGLATLESVRVARRPVDSGGTRGYGHVSLTAGQEAALNEIMGAIGEFRDTVFLLKGVTGSGKTEVYLRAIQGILMEGREAIVLVPEISLTPQTVARFRERFGDSVAVLHSRLSPGERLDEWMRIRRGQVSVAVGARSAVFAPFSNLGLIVVDEEHEASYKQDDEPKYHAVEVARARAEACCVPLVLGSATPSVESYAAATNGAYRLITLDARVDDRPMPTVSVVDMREELKAGNRSIFSRPLREALGEVLEAREQAVVFLNRRGFNTFVMCRECGHVMNCRNCDVSYTFHANPPFLKCHYCNGEAPVPVVCPECGSRYIRYFGAGTQRIEAEIANLFPDARTIRMDVDTTSKKDSHSQLLGRFARGEADFLVGTQMIAKGLDFPNVTLVGVIAADTSLNLPDYRAAERTFQLLTQVSGRAGRGVKPGRVVIQTYNPGHFAVACAAEHDFDAFYTREIEHRRDMNLPPFAEMGHILVTGSVEANVIATAQEVSGQLGCLDPSIANHLEVLGPAPAPIGRIEGRYRWHLVLKAANPETIIEALRGIPMLSKGRQGNGDIRCSATVRPMNLL